MHIYTENETLLKAENVSLIYDDKKILNNINLEIKNIRRSEVHQGQVIAFLGRSGRGKSSLFRLITGLEKPTSGKIFIPNIKKGLQPNGQFIMKEVSEGDVGFVDQKYTLFRHKTVYQALKFALRHSTLSEDEQENKINKYLETWGLSNHKNQYPNELSGGQRQRTAILEQIFSSTNYLVLDEPFSGLDVGNINNVKAAIKLLDTTDELNTVMFSTHDIDLAVELADTIYVLGHGSNAFGEIVAIYDIKKMGLAWNNQLTMQHINLIQEIKQMLLKT